MTFYFRGTGETNADAQAVVDRVRAALASGAGLWNRQISLQVSGDADIINVATGAVTNTISVTAPAVITGAENDDTYLPLGTAILLRAKTSTFLAGRRLQGRSFLSPLGGNQGDTNGTPNATALGLATLIGTNLHQSNVGEATWCIWRRPRAANATATPPVTARAGEVGDVTSWSAPDKYAILRSRRD